MSAKFDRIAVGDSLSAILLCCALSLLSRFWSLLAAMKWACKAQYFIHTVLTVRKLEATHRISRIFANFMSCICTAPKIGKILDVLVVFD